MTKRVFLIHGWGGNPDKEWFPWTKQQLMQLGYEVYAPLMPEANYPRIDNWISAMTQVVGKPEQTDIFIGHSIGCQAILRYFEQTPDETKVDKVIFVAGWHKLTNLDKDDKEIAKPWLTIPIDFSKIKHKANSFICIFSDNDFLVPFEENNKWFKDNLEVSTILEKGKGHFSEENGITEIPVLLKFF